MPAASTPVPHYKQSNPGACLPACARMVLASFGDERTESELAVILEEVVFITGHHFFLFGILSRCCVLVSLFWASFQNQKLHLYNLGRLLERSIQC